MNDDSTEVQLASRESAPSPIPGAMDDECATTDNDFSNRRDVPGKEHSSFVRLCEETPELSESIRECELLSLAMFAHAQIATRITGQIDEEADAIGRGSPLFSM